MLFFVLFVTLCYSLCGLLLLFVRPCAVLCVTLCYSLCGLTARCGTFFFILCSIYCLKIFPVNPTWNCCHLAGVKVAAFLFSDCGSFWNF